MTLGRLTLAVLISTVIYTALEAVAVLLGLITITWISFAILPIAWVIAIAAFVVTRRVAGGR